MPQLFVDADKIARARDLARSAANGVQALIDRIRKRSPDPPR